MLRCILLLTALLALPAFAQPLMPGTETAPVTPELTPEQRLTQFRHDEINLLALRGDAHSLLAAALMAQADAQDKRRPPALKSPALLKRAQQAGADDALVWWVSAAVECHDKAKTCPSTQTLQKLESVDAENAAVWALSLWHSQQAKDEPTARAALTSAAQAKRYNDYFGATIAILYDATSILPMSAELLNATGQNTGVDGYRLSSSAVIAATSLPPSAGAIAAMCKDATADTRLVDCVSVAKTLAASGSVMAQHFGVSLLESLLQPGPELDAAHAHARSLAWQMQRISELGDRLANDSRVSRVYTQALSEHGDEIAAVQAMLRSQGVTLEPPADWQPPQPDVMPKP